MIKPSEKLASSLEVLKELQEENPSGVFKGVSISRTHRDRLMNNGFLKEVIKGWYISTNPGDLKGDSTMWYASYWAFCAAYLNDRFDKEWVLMPDHSISLYSGNKSTPSQLVVKTPKGQNNKIDLPFSSSLFDLKSDLPPEEHIVSFEGMRLYSLPVSLINCSSTYYNSNEIDVRTALSLIKDSSEILEPLLEGGHSTIGGKLAGAFRNIGRITIADEILKTFEKAGYNVRETDPFDTQDPVEIPTIGRSPYVGRIHIMWQKMRNDILGTFPLPPGLPNNTTTYMTQVDETYQHDAYHSLSIEGYRVSPEIIERVRSGSWDPSNHHQDSDQVDAMAARGYYLAFQSVKQSLLRVLQGENSGDVTSSDHRDWYREMFTPSVTAGILRPADLAGYRNRPVFIKNSMHVPPSADAVRDAMPIFFELLSAESDPAVRTILGHFVFVFIHPYPDGNGRIARFLMNVMLASGGYPWTVIELKDRQQYMDSLEEASVNQNIIPFTEFIAGLLSESMPGE